MDASSSDSLLCSVDEAAHLLGVKRTFLCGLITSKQLRSCKLGRLRKIARVDVEAYVARLRAEGEAEGDLEQGATLNAQSDFGPIVEGGRRQRNISSTRPHDRAVLASGGK